MILARIFINPGPICTITSYRPNIAPCDKVVTQEDIENNFGRGLFNLMHFAEKYMKYLPESHTVYGLRTAVTLHLS